MGCRAAPEAVPPRKPHLASADSVHKPAALLPHGFLTHTFSECVENHTGMQTIGTKRERGLAAEEIEKNAAKYDGAVVHELGDATLDTPRANVVVFPSAVQRLLGIEGADALLAESVSKSFDDRFLNTRRKVVQRKHGRLNNCYADEAQPPDIANGKGTVHAFSDSPLLASLRAKLPDLLGSEAAQLFAETNYYTDVRRSEVGIGFHGDTERSVVIGVRLGASSMPLKFQWFTQTKPIGKERSIALKNGDVYAMSWKATGHDWRSRTLKTLRHGVGRKAKVKNLA